LSEFGSYKEAKNPAIRRQDITLVAPVPGSEALTKAESNQKPGENLVEAEVAERKFTLADFATDATGAIVICSMSLVALTMRNNKDNGFDTGLDSDKGESFLKDSIFLPR
jgi:hypothetical protein